MKRLSGWDAVLLYSETPNVHMHTVKVAVIELAPDRRDFDVEAFRQVIASRLDKLDSVPTNSGWSGAREPYVH